MGGKIDRKLFVDFEGKRVYVRCRGRIGQVKTSRSTSGNWRRKGSSWTRHRPALRQTLPQQRLVRGMRNQGGADTAFPAMKG